MDFALSETQKRMLNEIHALCEEVIKPYYFKNSLGHKEQTFDWYLIRLLGARNLICPSIPKEYGGAGLDTVTLALLMEEISASVPSLSAIIETNIHSIQPIILAGTQRQKELVLSDCIGENACLLSYALTEPTGGSSINTMNTYAEKTADGYVISGSKSYTLNAPAAKYILLFAFTNSQHKKSSLRCFIVPTNTPGVKMEGRYQLNTLDYACMSNITFDHVKVPESMVLKENEPYSGYFLLSQTQDIGKALIAATSVGMAKSAYQLAMDFAQQRMSYEKPIFHYQAVSHTLSDMATKIEMARLLTWKACWLIDTGGDFTLISAMAKLAASRIAQEVATCAADIMGAGALIKGSPMERLCNDIRMLSTVEGTNNIQKELIASLL